MERHLGRGLLRMEEDEGGPRSAALIGLDGVEPMRLTWIASDRERSMSKTKGTIAVSARVRGATFSL
jgi:hypothetical protein